MRNKDQIKILLIENNPEDAGLIRELLTKSSKSFNLTVADKLSAGIKIIQEQKFDVVLFDLNMPGNPGKETFNKLHNYTKGIPIIAIAENDDENFAAKILKAGGQDYIVKGMINGKSLMRSVQYAIERFNAQNGINDNIKITKHKETEQLQQKNEQFCRSLFENIMNGFAYFKMLFEDGKPVDLIFLEVNKAFEVQSGLKNVTGKKVSKLIPAMLESDPELLEIFGRVALTGKPEKFEMYVKSLNDWYSAYVYSTQPEYFYVIFDVVTERKQAEERLKSQMEFITTLLDTIPTPVFYKDVSGKYLGCNRAFEVSRGVSRESIIGKTVNDLVPAQFAEKHAAMDEQLFKQGEGYLTYEQQDLDADGTVKDAIFTKSLFRDSGGNSAGIISITFDITERNNTETALRESENTFSTIFRLSPIAISIIKMSDKKITKVNDAWCKILGFSKEEAIGHDMEELKILDHESRDRFSKEYLSKGYLRLIETEFTTKNGEKKYILASTELLTIKNEQFSINLMLDITERKHAEEELEKYREHLEELVRERTNELAMERNLLRTLIDSLPDEIYAKDIGRRFILANYNVLRTFGLSAFKDISGKTDFELLPWEKASKALEKERFVLQPNGQMINYQEHIKDTNGKIHWIEVSKVPMRDKEGKIIGLVGINRDITYFKEVEEKLKQAKESAESANLAKSTFLSSMSHEIRTPLNAILGFSELMQYDKNLTKKNIKWLSTINQSGEHLLVLINDILELSRIEAGHITFNPSTFDIHSMLNDIETMFRVKTNAKNLSLLMEYSGDLPKYIITDEGKLKQILINLVGNAAKFTKEGGIALRVGIKLENNKMRLIAEIEDTGPGIPDKDIDKLFHKFEQTETGIREGGTGLGLAISQQYAKLMNGIITVKSEKGKGSCFILTIDIAGDNGNDNIKKKDHKQRITGLKPGRKQYRILIADDRVDNRELLKIMLTSVGFKTEEAIDGNETIEKFKIWSPDLILMDMQMPVMNGYEAIRSIKAMAKGNIPIIAVTASAFQEDRQKALDAGADLYLRKPFKEDELFKCIETCLDVQYVYE